MLAFVDESLRQPEEVYVLGALVLAPTRLKATRQRFRGILLPGQKRFHWRDESEGRRQEMLALIAELEAEGFAARSKIQDGNAERARALGLRGLIWGLRSLGVNELVFESRQDHNDARDRSTIVGLKQATIAPPALRYRFRRPIEEPVLWGADSIAGAYCEGCVSDNSPYKKPLQGLLYGAV